VFYIKFSFENGFAFSANHSSNQAEFFFDICGMSGVTHVLFLIFGFFFLFYNGFPNTFRISMNSVSLLHLVIHNFGLGTHPRITILRESFPCGLYPRGPFPRMHIFPKPFFPRVTFARNKFPRIKFSRVTIPRKMFSGTCVFGERGNGPRGD
jgi:hypothetical protein